MTVKSETFTTSPWGVVESWEKLLADSAAFATQVGKERLINISASVGSVAVIVVWYWE